MADTYRFRRHGTRASVLVAGALLGLASVTAATAAEPVGTTDPVGPATESSTSTSTSTSSSTTSTSTTTSSTTTTTVPVITPQLVPPLVDSVEGSELGTAARTSRTTNRSARTSQERAASNGATLPFTGDSSLPVLGSGLAALAIGALALWWGSRKRPGVDVTDPR